MQRQRPLPRLKDNVALSPTINPSFSTNTPNVSRSWTAQDFRVRSDDRLTRSLGDRSQEKHVLDWCKKNNLNLVRKLPKLDPAVLTTRGVDTDKFMKFVEEPTIALKELPPKTLNAIKAKPAPLEKLKTKHCKYCQRDLPSSKRRHHPTFFTSPYECEHCGASNHIDDEDDDYDDTGRSSADDDATNISESVSHTIQRGDPARVIDHRGIHEEATRVAQTSDDLVVDDIEDMDIIWRDDSSEYSEYMKSLSLGQDDINEGTSHDQTRPAVFLTETTSNQARPVELKMAWDDEDSDEFDNTDNEMSPRKVDMGKTRTTDIDPRTTDLNSENKSPRLSSKKPHPPVRVRLFQEKDPVSGITVSVHGRACDDVTSGNVSAHLKSRRASLPIMSGSLERDSNQYLSDSGLTQDNEGSYQMAESPVANRSVGLSRVALMRLSRQNRGRGRGVRPASLEEGASRQRTRSHSPYSYYEREENQGTGDEM